MFASSHNASSLKDLQSHPKCIKVSLASFRCARWDSIQSKITRTVIMIRVINRFTSSLLPMVIWLKANFA